MPFEVVLGRLFRAPVRRQLGELADDESFNVRSRGFFVVEVRTHVANVGIRQADNLAGVAGVGENFLVAGETGIENDFAATAGTGARRAPVKYASVLERQRGRRESQCGQLFLPQSSAPSVA